MHVLDTASADAAQMAAWDVGGGWWEKDAKVLYETCTQTLRNTAADLRLTCALTISAYKPRASRPWRASSSPRTSRRVPADPPHASF